MKTTVITCLLSALLFAAQPHAVFADHLKLSATIDTIEQLDGGYRKKYSHDAPLHLSGMTEFDGDIYVVGDKEDDRALYQIKEKDGKWQITDRIKLDFASFPSLEGVACKGNHLFAVNEDPPRIYRFEFDDSLVRKKLTIDLKSFGVSPEFWKDDNEGFEGIAFDDTSRMLYIAKERYPRYILEVELDGTMTQGTVVSQFDVPPGTDTDSDTDESLGRKKTFSDLTFDQGFLYALERREYSIAKIDPATKRLVARLSFAGLKDKERGSLYHYGSHYGLAEAIVFQNDKILIGLDNNGENVDTNQKWVKQFHLSGNEPAIVTLERPDKF